MHLSRTNSVAPIAYKLLVALYYRSRSGGNPYFPPKTLITRIGISSSEVTCLPHHCTFQTPFSSVLDYGCGLWVCLRLPVIQLRRSALRSHTGGYLLMPAPRLCSDSVFRSQRQLRSLGLHGQPRCQWCSPGRCAVLQIASVNTP